MKPGERSVTFADGRIKIDIRLSVKNVRASGRVAVRIKGPMSDSSVTGIEPASGGRRYDITAPLERVELDSEDAR